MGTSKERLYLSFSTPVTLLSSGLGLTKADCEKFSNIVIEADRGLLCRAFLLFRAVWVARDEKLMLAKHQTAATNSAFRANVVRNADARSDYDAYIEQRKSKYTGCPIHTVAERRTHRLRQKKEMELWWRNLGSRRLHCPFCMIPVYLKHPLPSADPPDFVPSWCSVSDSSKVHDECFERFLYGSGDWNNDPRAADAGGAPDEVNDDEHEFDDDDGSDDE